MKLQVTQETTMAVPDGRGGWLNPTVDGSQSPVTLFRYKTLDDAEFKSIAEFQDVNPSPETLPYENNATETKRQVNGIPARGKEFWWPKSDNDDAEEEDDDGSTMEERKHGGGRRQRPGREADPTRHEKSVQRRERRLLKMDLEQRGREAACREELHSMRMAVLAAEKKAHEAKCSYYTAKAAAKMAVTQTSANMSKQTSETLRRQTLP